MQTHWLVLCVLCRALPSAWAATLVCLGHCRRKRRDFAGALTCYRRALVLEPSRAATLAAEAYTYHLMGELGAAIDRYHRVLAMQPDHSFAAEMLTAAIEEHSRQGLEFA